MTWSSSPPTGSRTTSSRSWRAARSTRARSDPRVDAGLRTSSPGRVRGRQRPPSGRDRRRRGARRPPRRRARSAAHLGDPAAGWPSHVPVARPPAAALGLAESGRGGRPPPRRAVASCSALRAFLRGPRVEVMQAGRTLWRGRLRPPRARPLRAHPFGLGGPGRSRRGPRHGRGCGRCGRKGRG